MILTSLREQTRPYHDRLEARLDILRLIPSQERYRALLQRFYGFYRPVEAALEPLATEGALGLDFTERRKTGRLERDLCILDPDHRPEDLPLCPYPPRLETPAQALGCLYVLEGATLGGQIISRQLREMHGMNETSGAAFFQSYGGEVGRMWKDFGVALNDRAATLSADPTIIASACETFERFERWVCIPEVCPPGEESHE